MVNINCWDEVMSLVPRVIAIRAKMEQINSTSCH